MEAKMEPPPLSMSANNQLADKSVTLGGKNMKRKGRLKMLLIIAVCAALMIASYFTSHAVKPHSRNNYGALLDPIKYVVPELGSTDLDGIPVTLGEFKEKWLMLQVDSRDFKKACKDKLFGIRQLRIMQGKERKRIERVWLITDDKPVDKQGLLPFDGTYMLRVNPVLLKAWLPTEIGTNAADHIYLIDPRSNLMMRFPKDADSYKVKTDLSKLLRASAIG